jgi:PKD repeat protein
MGSHQPFSRSDRRSYGLCPRARSFLLGCVLVLITLLSAIPGALGAQDSGDVGPSECIEVFHGDMPLMSAVDCRGRKYMESKPSEAPSASFTADPPLGEPPLEVSFDARDSTDPDGTVESYGWDLGDGATADTVTVTHTYTDSGEYAAVLTIMDNEGLTDTATIVIGVRPPPSSGDVIVDNLDSEFTTTDGWNESSAEGEYAGSSVYATSDGATATWTPSLPQAGLYHVFAWWCTWPTRAEHVPYKIVHASGSYTVCVNQRQNGGQWVSLGIHQFNAGSEGSVTVTREAWDGSNTSADAARFIRIVPVESIDINGPTRGGVNAEYTFAAAVMPPKTTLPITYTWQATDQAEIVTCTNALSHSAKFSWSVTGTKTITITATNADCGTFTNTATNADCSTFTNTHVVVGLHKVCLPQVLRCWPPIQDTPTLDPIVAPEDNASYTVGWNAVDEAQYYVLQEVAHSAGVTKTYTTTSAFLTIESRCLEEYEYSVKACNDCMCTDWSEPESVEVRWECEPNNSCPPQADDGPLDSGLTYYGTFLTPENAKDYFYFDVPTPHDVDVWLTEIPQGCDYDLVLRDVDCVQVGYSGEVGNADEHILTDVLPAGQYYIHVQLDKAGCFQPYYLKVTYQ